MRSSFRIETATSDTLPQALALEAAVYAADHGHVPAVEAGAVYFTAGTAEDGIVASFRILGPQFRPFEFEAAVDLSFLGADRRAGLIGRLCVRPDFRSTARQATLPIEMLRTAFGYCRANDLTDLLMFTFPHLYTFYERAQFRRCGEFFHTGYATDMGVLHLDLVRLAERLAAGDRRALTLFGSEAAAVA